MKTIDIILSAFSSEQIEKDPLYLQERFCLLSLVYLVKKREYADLCRNNQTIIINFTAIV